MNQCLEELHEGNPEPLEPGRPQKTVCVMRNGFVRGIADQCTGDAHIVETSFMNQELIRASIEGRSNDAQSQLVRGANPETRRPLTIQFDENSIEDDKKDTEVRGLTPLMHAALAGHIETCRILLDASADVNAEDEDLMRPLHFAAKSGNAMIFSLLLHARADPSCEDVDGCMPMEYWNVATKADSLQSCCESHHGAVKLVPQKLATTMPCGMNEARAKAKTPKGAVHDDASPADKVGSIAVMRQKGAQSHAIFTRMSNCDCAAIGDVADQPKRPLHSCQVQSAFQNNSRVIEGTFENIQGPWL